MSILGRKLSVALVAAGVGSWAGFGSGVPQGVAQANRPIVQTIAASQPTRVKLAVFHPSANPERELARPAEQSVAPPIPETTLRRDVRPPSRTAPVARGPLNVGSGLDEVPASPRRANSASTPNKKPVERSRQHARFGQSEIVDPWSAKR